MTLSGLRPSGRKDRSESSKHKVEKKHEKKREKKLQFHAKVKDAAVTLGAKKTIKKNKKKRLNRQKKMKAYDLSALAEFLPDLSASQHPDATNAKLSRRSRKKLLQRESTQLKAVLNNPTFQMDPVSAIHNHLKLTQPPSEVDVNKEKKPKRPGNSKKKLKAKKKGAIETSSDSPSYMDI
ncbi:uncharacterized protein M6B38_264700 [Iris pallida]|uniref:Ribosome biogenesis protein slx9-like n=1 Tax=Iris pallida TaxID=29817 RepID=A0AAX6IBF0_IRIPA|nr:uncharacterized protein M6B38_264700 [Iris pallida]